MKATRYLGFVILSSTFPCYSVLDKQGRERIINVDCLFIMSGITGGEVLMRKSNKLFLGLCIGGIFVVGVVLMPLARVLFHSEMTSGTIIAEEPHLLWRDGVYVGSAVNKRGETNILEVTIENGRFKHIEALNKADTSIVFTKVFRQISQKIIAKNSLDVDTVSGATVSSQGILAAVKNAVDQAEK